MRGQRSSVLWGIPVSLVGLVLALPWAAQTGTSSGSRRTARAAAARQVPPPAKAARARSSRSPAQQYSPIQPFVEFHDVGKPDAGVELGKQLASAGDGMDLEFLVAILPDPIDSRFAYRFDGMLDSIEDAVGSRGWILDHFWLPWAPNGQQPDGHEKLKSTLEPETEKEGTGAGSTPSGDGTLLERLLEKTLLRQAEEKSTTPLQEIKPGMLVFRKPKDPGQKQQVLITLVVGETPTTGVHKKAFYKSLNIINSYFNSLNGQKASDLKKTDGKTSRPWQFRIIGPSFSGSEQSVSLAIARWLKDGPKRQDDLKGQHWHFRVVTGAALKIDRDRFIGNALGGSRQAQVEFSSTVSHFDKVMPALFDFLWQRNGMQQLGKVALLTESDTEFGKSIDKQMMDRWVAGTPAAGAGGQATATRGPGKARQVTQMKFPFHISQVALAYDEEGRKLGRNTPALVRPSSRLTIPFDETGSPRDTAPALSPQMSTATTEFILQKILETISLEDFRYIGIVATDTRDTIFLAGLIHQYCPDVQVFAPEGDLLVAHPTYSAELRGMILASSYPLFSMVQRWDPPYKGDRRRNLFSRQEDEGTFNATLWLLLSRGADSGNGNKPLIGSNDLDRTPNSELYDALFDYGQPFDNLRDFKHFWSDSPGSQSIWLRDRTWPMLVEGQDRPPIWFSIVGQHGLWPLRFEDVDPDENQKGASKISEYVRKATYSKELTRDEFVDQFIALVPQFTWHWGAAFLALTGFAWSLIRASTRSIVLAFFKREPRGVSFAKILRLSSGEGGGDWTIATMRELYILIGHATLMGTCYFFAVRPCWIVMRYSPWAVFSRDDLWNYLPDHDRWNWRFATFSICFGFFTLCLLGLTGILRFAVFLQSWLGAPTPPTHPIVPTALETSLFRHGS